MKGAAVAAAQEAAPFLLKAAIGAAIFLIVTPMLVFIALPSIFFGYDSSETSEIQELNTKAASLRSAYMSLEDFEKTEIDAVVTGIAAEYERQGLTIGEIEVDSSFDEEDLMWMVSINSVADRQNLDVTTADVIRERCKTQLVYDLWDTVFDDGSVTLKITFQKLDPEALMNELHFDAEEQAWARLLYTSLSEGDVLNTYVDEFEPYTPSYSGVTWDGSYTSGEAYDNTIDLSRFVDPSTKNNLDLAIYATQAWENNWGYVWGTFGTVLTPGLFAYKIQQYPEGVGNYEDYIREHWMGRRTSDCVGLFKGYGWLDGSDGEIKYGTNGVPDFAADQMYNVAVSMKMENGPISEIPDIPGLVLWMPGHTGVYIGGGYAVEAMGTKYGVVRTEVAGRGWSAWYKSPYITYLED